MSEEDYDEDIESENSGGIAMKMEDGELVLVEPIYMTKKEWAKVNNLFETHVKIKDILENADPEQIISEVRRVIKEHEEFVKNPVVPDDCDDCELDPQCKNCEKCKTHCICSDKHD